MSGIQCAREILIVKFKICTFKSINNMRTLIAKKMSAIKKKVCMQFSLGIAGFTIIKPFIVL